MSKANKDQKIQENKKISPKKNYKPRKGSFLFTETPEVYDLAIKPFLPTKVENWVDNIIQRKAEQEHVIRQTEGVDGYIAIISDKNQKKTLTGETASTLYHKDILMFFNKLSYQVRSLRDLTATHLAIIKQANADFLDFLEKKYAIPKNNMVAFLHYPPSTYALHIHYMRREIAILTQKSHQLDHVIANIETDPKYYQSATLKFPISIHDHYYKLVKPYL